MQVNLAVSTRYWHSGSLMGKHLAHNLDLPAVRPQAPSKKQTPPTEPAKPVPEGTRACSLHRIVRLKRRGIPSSLTADALWMLIGNSAYLASQWAVLVVLAKWMSPVDVGIFTFALAVTAPVAMFLNLDLRSLLVTDTGARYTLHDYSRLRELCCAATVVITALIGILYPGVSWDQRLVVLLIGTAKSIESRGDIQLGLLQRERLHRRAATYLIAKGVLSTIGALAAAAAMRSVIAVSLALVVAWAVCNTFLNRVLCRRIHVEGRGESEGSSAQRVCSLFWLALPMGVSMLLISLQTSIPRLFLESFVSTSDQGIFAALSYPWVLGSLLLRSVSSVAAPRYRDSLAARSWGSFVAVLALMLTWAIVIGAAGAVCALFLGEKLLTLIYTPEYAEYRDVFVCLAIANALGYAAAVVRHATVALRRLRSYLGVTIVATVMQTIACAVLVHRLGLLGAALSNLVLGAVQLIGTGGLLLVALRVEKKSAQSV